MRPRPQAKKDNYRGSDKLLDQVALITGGASRSGHVVASAFAREDADVVSVYLDEHPNAAKTKRQVEEIAPGYVFLASQDASDLTRQVLHSDGGAIVNGSADRRSACPGLHDRNCIG